MAPIDSLQQSAMQFSSAVSALTEAIPLFWLLIVFGGLCGLLVLLICHRRQQVVGGEFERRAAELEQASEVLKQTINQRTQSLADLDWQHREHEKSHRADLERASRRDQEFAVKRSQLETRIDGLQSQRLDDERRLEQLQTDSRRREDAHSQRVEGLQNALTAARGSLQEQAATSFERDRHHVEQLAMLEANREQLKGDFENLANRIFDEKSQQFSQKNTESVSMLLKPFREQIQNFEKRVNEVHDASLSKHSSLQSEIGKVVELGARMGEDALNLTNALKGNKKVQGDWGELQLELLLQDAGLRKGIEYDTQVPLRNEDGEQLRPDFVLHLPEDKHIVVDSKVSLNAYIEAVSADSDATREAALDQLVVAFRQHFRTLSHKNYGKLLGLRSTELVFMFVPTEPAYLAAAQRSPGLFREAYQHGVAVVTPSTLMACLRIVAHLWTIDKQNQNTVELAAQAAKVHDKLRLFLERMERLGQQLQTVQKTYDVAWNGVRDGQGSLARQVDRFRELGAPIIKNFPQSVVGAVAGIEAGDSGSVDDSDTAAGDEA